MTRVKIADFGIINKNLANAVVTIYVADENGVNSGVKATLYQAATGDPERANPQTLDDDGKLEADCYIDGPVVGSITGINAREARSLKKIRQNPLEFHMPISSAHYFQEAGGDLYADLAAIAAAVAAVEAVLADAGFVAVSTDLLGANTIGTVAGIAAAVSTVAGISADVTTVAGISANVTTVAGIAANVTTVAGISANVTTVAGISANVTTVAGISANVTTVAGISAAVTTVAGISAAVSTVATNIADVNTCATNIAAIIAAPAAATAAATAQAAAEAARDLAIAAAAADATLTDIAASGNLVINTNYLVTGGALVTGTLPAVAAKGSKISITGNGAGGWAIAQGAGQQIIFGSVATSVGAPGSLASTNQYDVVHLRCVVANTTWQVTGSIGNITYV